MPIYEYRCDHCGHELEVMQKLADPPLTDCPECGEVGLKKLISPVGFRFKGGGWYETDFKTANKRNLADSGAASGSDNKKTEGDQKPDTGKTDNAKTGDKTSATKADAGKGQRSTPSKTTTA